MHVSDMIGQRRQTLQREVTYTNHTLILTMMDLTTNYPMKIHVDTHTWE